MAKLSLAKTADQPPYGRKRSRRSFAVKALIAVVAVIAFIFFSSGTANAEEYEVQPGDSLSVIARDHGVTTDELAAANGISDLHLIRIGQKIEIPSNEYEVQAGDTLGGIAARLGVSTQALIDGNGLEDANVIRVGQQLRVPTGGVVAPVNPAANYPSLPGRLLANPDRLALIPSFEKWSAHYGVPQDLLMAMAYRESGWQNDVVSNKGALGVGQLLPGTATWVANDLIGVPELDTSVPDDNIRMSARLLKWLIGYMGGESPAMAGYYQGPGSVQARGYYDDTQEYIDNVQQIRSRFVRQ